MFFGKDILRLLTCSGLKMAIDCFIVLSCFTGFLAEATGNIDSNAPVPYEVVTPSPSESIEFAKPTMITASDKAMTITWVNSTTSSIAVSWRFNKKYGLNGTYIGSRVEYFLKEGRFRSHFMPLATDTFVFENLKVATQYKICITLYETVIIRNAENSYEHTQCFKLSTIPYIRRDSVLILLCVLSYFFFMGLMGYSQWRRKVTYIRSRIRRENSASSSSEPVTPVLRWRELEERQRLFHPTSSIEESPKLL